MGQNAGRAGNVGRFGSAHEQCIGNQGPMTAPGHGLRAHQRQPVVSGQFEQFVDRSAKFLGLHVIGVTAKRQIPPAGIRRVGRGPAQPPKRRMMHVGDPRRTQRSREILAIELRIVSGPRHSSHIDDPCDAVRAQQPDKLGDGTRGVADREYAGRRSFRASCGPGLGHGCTESGSCGSESARRPGALLRRSDRCTHDREFTRAALTANRSARLRAGNGPPRR